VLVISVLWCVTAGHAQQVDLYGWVYDNNVNPKEGVVAVLNEAGLHDTTDASGKFHISGTLTGTVINSMGKDIKSKPSVSSSWIRFGVNQHSAHVSINAFDVQGRKIAKGFAQELDKGNYKLGIGSIAGNTAHSVYIIKGHIGKKTFEEKYVAFATAKAHSGLICTSRPSHTGLGKKVQATIRDTVSISYRGQPVTSIGITEYSDTLDDVYMVARSITGNVLASDMPIGSGNAMVSGYTIAEGEPVTVNMEYNESTQQLHGTFYAEHVAQAVNYQVYINVIDSSGNSSGRSDRVQFSSMEASVTIDSIDPSNTIPRVDAGNDTLVGIGDSVILHASASDTLGGTIEFCEWKIGEVGMWKKRALGDTVLSAPSTALSLVCSVRVADNDGNMAYDAIAVTVETRAPVAVAAGDTAVFVNEQVHLYGSDSYDETKIVDYSWKIGDGSWVSVSTGDTTITVPGTAQTLVCSLRVTDDDGNSALGNVSVLTSLHSVDDADGNTYSVIKIGDQFWTVENLRTTKYNDSSDIPNVTEDSVWEDLSTGAYCYYDNDSAANADKYGALYNWYAVNTGKLAPDGWRVPTDDDWTELEEYLIANGYNWDGSVLTNKIGKALAAKSDWTGSSDEGAVGNDLSSNNATGFSALPGGYRYDYGYFFNQSNYGNWWGATEFGASSAYYRNLFYDLERLYRNYTDKEFGFSVRLVRDVD
jgi:uncharacterized protein (TIGR02145 family)